MSCFVFQVGVMTPGAGVADAIALNTASGQFMALQGGAANQQNFIDEVYMGGQSASTAVMIMLLGHDSVLGATLTGLVTPNSNGPTNILAGVLTAPAAGFIAATTPPQRSNSTAIAKKNFTFNAFGGIVRANYANTQDRMSLFGNATTTTSEVSLSPFTGTNVAGVIGAHIIYETM